MFKDKIDFWWEEATKFMRSEYRDVDGISAWKTMWLKSKEDFLPYFDEDGRLKITVSPQNVKYGKEDIDFSLNKLYDTAYMLVHGDKAKFPHIKADPSSVHAFIVNITRNFTVEEMIGNRILTTNTHIGDVSVPTGTKLSKYIGKCFDHKKELYDTGFDTEYANRFFSHRDAEQIARIKDYVNVVWSMFINDLKSSGTAVLSVNPLDYLLVSHHNNNWRSCHNILNGEYKAGGVSYMLDKVSLVGYAYSREEHLINHNFKSEEKIPLKEWRAMVFINDSKDNAIISRQYPANKGMFQKSVENLACNLMNTIKGSNLPIVNASITSKKSGDYFYLDYITSAIALDGAVPRNIYVGAQSIPCLHCGNFRSDDYASRLTCYSCEDDYECTCCGDRCSSEYYFDGEYYCESCYEEELSTCDCCGELHHRSDVEYIDGQDYCESCRDEYFVVCCHCDDYVHVNNVITSESGDYYCDSCANERLYICSSCGNYVEDAHEINDSFYCHSCATDLFTECHECGEFFDDTTEVDGNNYCCKCAEELFVVCDCGAYCEKDALVCPICNACLVKEEVLV